MFCSQHAERMGAPFPKDDCPYCKILSLIFERDRWKERAEQKIALRREIQAELGISTQCSDEDALNKGLEAIRKLKAKKEELCH